MDVAGNRCKVGIDTYVGSPSQSSNNVPQAKSRRVKELEFSEVGNAAFGAFDAVENLGWSF